MTCISIHKLSNLFERSFCKKKDYPNQGTSYAPLLSLRNRNCYTFVPVKVPGTGIRQSKEIIQTNPQL